MTSETLRNMLVKQEPDVVNCYVCAGARAEYPLFTKPYGDRPFFPFLEHHNPPAGSDPISIDGRVLACSLCAALLTQQWNTHEKNKVPYSKRLYWLKRLDDGTFAGMEVNLQQDYESLFDSCHGPVEPESRPKPRTTRNSQTPTADAKKNPKFPVRSESRDSSLSSLSSRCEKMETPESCVNNALDLSMPGRTPSQSSSTPGPEPESCFACGVHASNFLSVFVKPIMNCPFFPSLLFHTKLPSTKPVDENGKVRVCDNCHKNLLLQWDMYQRQNVPQNERFYNIKVVNSVLPLTKQESPVQGKTFVCFTCGTSGQLSIKREISSYPEKEGDPYFTFLAHITPHHGAEPLLNGKATVCSLCYKAFFRQLRVYELSNVPEEQRKYKIHNDTTSEEFSVLRQHLKGSGVSQSTVKISCYVCDKLTDTLLLLSTLPNNPMYFPFIRTLSKPVCAKAIREDGVVEVCKECFVSLKFQWEALEHGKIPVNQRQYSISSTRLNMSKKNVSVLQHSVESVTSNSVKAHLRDVCCLCLQRLTEETVKVLETVPNHGQMYFPFIRSYLKADDQLYIDQYGRVLTCSICHSLLKNQWDMYEVARIPHSQRQYHFHRPMSNREMKSEPVDNAYLQSASSALHVHVPSPDLKVDVAKTGRCVEPLLTTVTTIASDCVAVSNAPSNRSPHNDTKISVSKCIAQSAEDGMSRPIVGSLDAPMGRPLLLNAVCFVCAEYSTSTPMYAIHSQPYENNPFFPFLAKRTAPEGAEKLSLDGSSLVCIFCYHTLLSQYLAYDASPYSEDMNPWHRTYNTYNYVCYICGITTYRQRACSISVRDFPFLSEHSRPLGALVLLGGECVVTCLTCFESFTSQWKDFERMKVPLTMRKYNWIVFPPPPDDEKSRGCQILPGQESASSDGGPADRNSSPNDATASDTGLPHGCKPPPHVPVQSIYGSKPSSRAVASVSPSVHQNAQHGSSTSHSSYENSSSALNATRTSSFAAALRKLAKQAVDPIAERDGSPQNMGSKNMSSSSAAYNSSHIPMSSASIPAVTVSPAPSHVSYDIDKRKEYVRYSGSIVNNSRSAEPVNFKSEYSKHVSSHEDHRSESSFEGKQSTLYSTLSQYSTRDDPNALSHGFQPYRNTEEPPPASQIYEHSPPGYSYHRPIYPPSTPSQNYRLEDSVYLERYGMLRPPAVSFPPSTNVIPFPGMPFYPSNRYPPGLIAQPSSLPPSHSPAVKSERPRSDERFSESDLLRVRDTPEHVRGLLHARERNPREVNSCETTSDDKARRIYSPLSLQITSRTESPLNVSSRMESVPYNNSHDMLLRKHSPSSSSAPLNLVKHTPSVSPYPEEIGKWKIKQHYASNGQSYNSGGPPHVRSSFESPLEHKFHPPPLISETQQESHSQRSVQKLEDAGSGNMLVYNKYSPYSAPEYQRIADDAMYSRRSGSQLNGALPREVYEGRNPYESEHCHRETVHRSVAEDFAKTKTPVRNGALPLQDSASWIPPNYYAGDKLRQHQETLKNSAILSSASYSSSTTPHYPSKDASITRALLQNQITPSIIDRYFQSSDDLMQKEVSKLDQRERKLRQLRQTTGDPDCELTDSESDEDADLKLREFLLITKGPPLEYKVNPQKLGFFKTVGLTTQPKKQFLEWRKYMRRRKLLRDTSCSPVIEDPRVTTQYDDSHLAELSKRLCVEDDSENKRAFLQLLGLTKVTQVKSEQAEPMDVSPPATEVGQSDPVTCPPTEKHSDEPPEPPYKKRFTLLTKLHMDSLNKCGSSNPSVNGDCTSSIPNVPNLKRLNSSPSPSSFSKLTSKSVPTTIPPLIRMEASMPAPDKLQSNGKPLLLSQDPRVKLLDRSFAQEFHESVLQATQIQLGHRTSTDPPEPKSLSFSEVNRFADENVRNPFSWPGIEAIMEAYENHLSEQYVEKEFLLNRLQYLTCYNQELTTQITCLGQKTSDLVQKKSCLDTETVKIEASVDNLKSIFKQIR